MKIHISENVSSIGAVDEDKALNIVRARLRSLVKGRASAMYSSVTTYSGVSTSDIMEKFSSIMKVLSGFGYVVRIDHDMPESSMPEVATNVHTVKYKVSKDNDKPVFLLDIYKFGLSNNVGFTLYVTN